MQRLDSEFGVNESEEEKNVIVSPKSSMISSRLAEPETADHWANRMIEFHTRYGHMVDMHRHIPENIQVLFQRTPPL